MTTSVLHTLELTDAEILFLLEASLEAGARQDFDIAQLRALMAKLRRKLKDPR